MIEVRLAPQGMGMADGTLVQWLKQEGDRVAEGEPILEVEAAKAIVEVVSPADGVLAKILVNAQENVPVLTILALIEETSEREAAVSHQKQATPLARTMAATNGLDLSAIEGSGPRGKVRSQDVRAAVGAAAVATSTQVEPRARKLAKENDLDLGAILGTGPNGRILEDDVRKALDRTQELSREPPPTPAPAPAPGTTFSETAHSPVRKTIARRLSEAKRDIPHFYLTIHCNMNAALDMRGKINAAWQEGKLSVNDLVVKAVSLALIEHPDINASWTEEALHRHASVDVAVAVATDNGLYTPIVRDAHTKTVKTIANETKLLSERARSGRLQPAEYQGGGITISNLGMHGISEFAAIINPPQAAILAVGAAEERAIVVNRELRVATMMTCTLSADHRVVDGAAGAAFLATVKKLLEEPLALLA